MTVISRYQPPPPPPPPPPKPKRKTESQRQRRQERQERTERNGGTSANERRPKVDGSRVNYNGKTTDAYTRELAQRAEQILGEKYVIMQGSYNPGGVAASAGTHDGGGALDISVSGKSPQQIKAMVEALREAGFAAWNRGPPSFTPHIHAIAIGAPNLSPAAQSQVRSYAAGGDGLSGNAPDPHAGDIGRPMPEWAQKLLGADPSKLFPTGDGGSSSFAVGGTGGTSSVGGGGGGYEKIGSSTAPSRGSNAMPKLDASIEEMLFKNLLAAVQESGDIEKSDEYKAWKAKHPGKGVKDFLKMKVNKLMKSGQGYFDLNALAIKLQNGGGKIELQQLSQAVLSGTKKPWEMAAIPIPA